MLKNNPNKLMSNFKKNTGFVKNDKKMYKNGKK